jgi:hypothetical protein
VALDDGWRGSTSEVMGGVWGGGGRQAKDRSRGRRQRGQEVYSDHSLFVAEEEEEVPRPAPASLSFSRPFYAGYVSSDQYYYFFRLKNNIVSFFEQITSFQV